jgi:nucleotide-binding universal stress UspA family protein
MTEDRKFLTLADDSRECLPAIKFAAMRAHKVGAGLVILRVFKTSGMGHWTGINEDMRVEARDHALAEAQSIARDVKATVGLEPEVVVREGKTSDALSEYVDQDPAAKVLVLGSGWGRSGPGPLISKIGKGKALTRRPIAITIIPGDLSEKELDEMGGADH